MQAHAILLVGALCSVSRATGILRQQSPCCRILAETEACTLRAYDAFFKAFYAWLLHPAPYSSPEPCWCGAQRADCTATHCA
jgi:hypothetical protein